MLINKAKNKNLLKQKVKLTISKLKLTILKSVLTAYFKGAPLYLQNMPSHFKILYQTQKSHKQRIFIKLTI